MLHRSMAWVVALGLAASSGAQPCGPAWLPGAASPLVTSSVRRCAVLPDARVAMTGSFTFAGGLPVRGLALWNGAGWEALGDPLLNSSGSDGLVRALRVTSAGVLVAGGNFTRSPSRNLNGVAWWTGVEWRPFGAGVDAPGVWDLCERPGGDIVVVGSFTQAGGLAAPGIARWDGAAWHPIVGVSGTWYGVAALPDGRVAVAGSDPQGNAMLSVGDDRGWTRLVNTSSHHEIDSVAVTADGTLYAGGFFHSIEGVAAESVARWTGSGWAPLGLGVDGPVSAMRPLPGGSLLVCGTFHTVNGQNSDGLGLWEGGRWRSLGRLVGGVNDASATPDGFVVVGEFDCGEQRWDGARWSVLAEGFDRPVRELLPLANGDLIALGEFRHIGGFSCGAIARWTGGGWRPLGGGLQVTTWGANRYCLAELPDGSIVAGGTISYADGVSVNSVARWDGTTWGPLGAGLGENSDRDVHALQVMPDGGLIAGGSFVTSGGVPCPHIARWDGARWNPLGSGMDGLVHALAVLPDGSLLAGGEFSVAGGVNARGIARWNGASWTAFGGSAAGSPVVNALAVDRQGGVIAAGDFTQIGAQTVSDIARWDGAQWRSMGGGAGISGVVLRVRIDDAGGVVAAGEFRGPGGITNLARWSGSQWLPLSSSPSGRVSALALRPGGQVAIGGEFVAVGGAQTPFFARWTPDGVPAVVQGPAGVRLACRGAGSLRVVAEPGGGPLTFEWSRDGAPVVIDGARVTVESDAVSSTLSIRGARAGDAGMYECRVGNPCGAVISPSAELSVPCCADVNADGFLDFFDYLDFVACFESGSCAPGVDADFGGDGFVDFFDYLDFVGAFEAGC